MSDEHNISSQSSMQSLPTWLPIIILRRAEEQLPAVREVIVGAVCRQNNYIVLFWGIFMAQRIKGFFLGSCATFHFLWFRILSLIYYICILECTL